MIASSKRDNSGFGIEGKKRLLYDIGYHVPTSYANYSKSPSARLYGRSNDWMSDLLKEKAKVPSPDRYDLSVDPIKNAKMALNKSPR
jgi:hypothetical protein